ncbi:fimbrial protein [Citrobacter farmeri]|uniref:Fimbrial-type adhesion domain-containing protein n=1 Tax=Citrobacter amalonaticus Y19 TaxID=1261127 RepID=M1KH26_CITAM|nr:fimbrial protein [Citrobacter amalonaticus]AGE94449.1 hypothetical protein F384_07910 [Citrobacter amalonaticus Y19]EKV5654378.1 fimbrial protein [Citrobacter farmeri]
MRKTTWFIALAAMTTASTQVRAEDNYTNTTTITVNVTVNSAPCDINPQGPITVDFGNNIAVTDVAAGLVEKNISYDLDCSSMDTTKLLKMTIQGTGVAFDNNVLTTSIANLGVKIKANGMDYSLNTGIIFSSAAAKPTLKALLVQKPGARLQTGLFTASATMLVEYQ